MNQAIIGLGSNISSDENIAKAREQLSQNFTVIAQTPFVKTKPVGNTAQADFLNGAMLIETNLSFDDLKSHLKVIEQELGRAPHIDKYASRTIDLDILVWNEKIIDPDFYTRDFIKRDVLQLKPDLKH